MGGVLWAFSEFGPFAGGEIAFKAVEHFVEDFDLAGVKLDVAQFFPSTGFV